MVPSPDPHASRSALEGALCAELRQAGLSHEHRSLHFRVHLASGQVAEFTPDLVARRGAVLFLIEPLTGGAADRNRLELLERFLETHSPEIVLVVVTMDQDVAGLPPASYDEAYLSTEAATLARRIREQDPKGIVLPFKKPTRARSEEHDVRDDG